MIHLQVATAIMVCAVMPCAEWGCQNQMEVGDVVEDIP
jgi:hypothetical protein